MEQENKGTCSKYSSRRLKSLFAKLLADEGFKVEETSKGGDHYYFTSFFFRVGNQWLYWMSFDYRFEPTVRGILRTAKGPNDFTGGQNHLVSISNLHAVQKNLVSLVRSGT